MIRLWALSKTVLREFIRERVFFVTFFIGIFLFLLSFLLGALSFAEQDRMIGNFGFLGVFISSAIMAAYIGSFHLAKEIERQTLLLTLSRAVSRRLLIFSRFLGFWLFIGFQISVLTFVIAWLVADTSQQWRNAGIIGVTIWMQSGYLFCMGLLASQLVRPPVAFTWTLTVALVSFWLTDLKFFAEKSKVEIYQILADGAGYIFPRFDKTNWKSHFYMQSGIEIEQFFFMLAHLSFWIVGLILVAAMIFRRRDLV